MNSSKNFLWLGPVFASVFFLALSSSFAEDATTVSTYYPAPYGSYKNLRIQNQNENSDITTFTQSLDQAGLNIITDFQAGGAYTPGVFWSTWDNNPDRPKAGIWMFEDATVGIGSKLFFGTSNNFNAGITNNGLVLDQNGNVGIGTATPGALLDVNGVGAHGLGAVGAPSFTFRSDLTTGMWSSGANTLNFSTAGQERMRIDASGGVGIGTAPNAKAILDLSSTEKAFLPPRMNGFDRDRIATPADGLVIYNTDNRRLNMYNSSTGTWQVLGTVATGPVAVSDNYRGLGTLTTGAPPPPPRKIFCGFRPKKVDVILYNNPPNLGSAFSIKWEKIDGMPENQSLLISTDTTTFSFVGAGGGRYTLRVKQVTSNLNIVDDGFTVAGNDPDNTPDFTGQRYYYTAYP